MFGLYHITHDPRCMRNNTTVPPPPPIPSPATRTFLCPFSLCVWSTVVADHPPPFSSHEPERKSGVFRDCKTLGGDMKERRGLFYDFEILKFLFSF